MMSDDMAQEKADTDLKLAGTEAEVSTVQVQAGTLVWEGEGNVAVIKVLVPGDKGGALANILQTMTMAAQGINGNLEVVAMGPVNVKTVTEAEMTELRAQQENDNG